MQRIHTALQMCCRAEPLAPVISLLIDAGATQIQLQLLKVLWSFFDTNLANKEYPSLGFCNITAVPYIQAESEF